MARRLTKDEIISNVYYNLDTGYGSIQATHKKAKEEDPTSTLEDVKTFLKKQPENKSRIIEVFLHRTVCSLRIPNRHNAHDTAGKRQERSTVCFSRD